MKIFRRWPGIYAKHPGLNKIKIQDSGIKDAGFRDKRCRIQVSRCRKLNHVINIHRCPEPASWIVDLESDTTNFCSLDFFDEGQRPYLIGRKSE
jgi:Ni,Fe-hydrogenase I small subunit